MEKKKRHMDEAAFLKSESLFHLVISNAPLVIFALNHEGIFVRSEGKALEVLGLEAGEVVGLSVFELYKDFPQIIKDIKRALAGEAFTSTVSVGELYFETRYEPVQDKSGHGIGTIGISTEITKRKKAEAELKKHAAELKKRNLELEEFAAIASHDLRSPLISVLSAVKLLKGRLGDTIDEESEEEFKYISDRMNSMLSVIKSLLEFARLGSTIKKFKAVDFETVLDQSIANLQLEITNSGVVLTHDALPVIKADDILMTQVFQNLISNAISCKRDGVPRIHIKAQKKRSEWVISVHDNGIGICAEDAMHIFKFFYSQKGAGKHLGSGIGLAACKKIVEMHSGKIWVESEPDNGATFYFTIKTEDKKAK